ncbi:Leucine Rich Repeat family protein [Trichomonas vaginalis G3]|uniref:Leucine Rich Repeat family protein n=1 Tax=Trichomonas vaginalis (strain ATCC PRA-98 / G3) TaxID=412133 RepID=A2E5U1_TRIV3|nr:uncharacterized protein TVAGG3_0256870 [Trichomonas vaginalis G3]EAY12011.1 Leucine Rich Repeat family protein [Trichomonas vaginalis G3]KAI5524815.1 leucine-rich repeat, isoform f-related family [Trichomonas vaginalis G3]|eukprot:XP_001324234.1 hypothetical protein [Trichomonas vaginalis G3]
MTQIDQLSSVHPIFKSFKNEILFFDQVEKLNRHGDVDIRHLVVHTAGIFLLETKPLIRTLWMSRVIPLADLQYFHVSNSTFTVKSENDSFTIKCKIHLNVAAQIYALRKVLFPQNNNNCVFQIESDILHQFESIDIDFEPESILGERFLGYVFSSTIQYNDDYVKSTYGLLCPDNNVFVINPTILSNPYILEIISSFSCGNEVTEIDFENFDIGQVLDCFYIITHQSKNVKTLVFRGMNFETRLNDLKNLFENAVLNNLTDIIFETCRFCHPDVHLFFDAFSSLKSCVKCLHFSKSLITSYAIDSIFQMLFFSSCFHSLQSLSIRDLTNAEDLSTGIFQLLCCGWVLKSKCMKHLNFSNSSMNIGKLLSNIKDIDCGVLELNLSYNTFTNLSGNLILPGLTNLILNHCTFVSDALYELFSCLSQQKHLAPLTIDVSDALCTPSSFASFYQNSPKLIIPELQTLIWDGNQVSGKNIEPFMKFLKNQPNLSNLSLNFCFDKKDHETTLIQLSDLFKTLRFNQLCIAANGDHGFGQPLTTCLEYLLNNSKNLHLLDITNQRVTDVGLFLVLRQLPPSLEAFYFEGFNPSTVDSICTILSRVTQSNTIKKSLLPELDIVNLYTKTPLDKRSDMKKKIHQVREDFIHKYGFPSKERIPRTQLDTSINFQSAKSSKLTKEVVDKEIMKQIMKEESDYIIIDDYMISYFEELSGVVGTCPIIPLVNEMHQRTSLKSLLGNLGLN